MRKSPRTAAVVCAVLAVALTATAVATAAYKTGHYEGTTSQGHAIDFKATELGVKNFGFTVEVPCDDGSVQALRATGAKAPTNDRGRFKAVFTGVGTTVARGKLKGKRATGTIKSTGAFNQETGAACPDSRTDWGARRR